MHFRRASAQANALARTRPAIVFQLITCPRCRRARLVEPGRKTASCGSCGRTLVLADLRSQWAGEALDDARRMLGAINARLDGREAEFAVGIVPPAPRPRKHDGPHEAAASAARGGRGEADRVDRIARALGQTMGEFSDGDLQKAMHLAGVPSTKATDHRDRMLVTHVIFEPRPGRYKAF